jgi:hypothetical protein
MSELLCFGPVSTIGQGLAFGPDPAAGGPAGPAQFGTGDWSVSDLNTVDGARITISALPDDGGSAITDLEYQVDGGAWISLAGTTADAYDVADLAFNTAQAIAIRAINALGNGTASATKSVTPTGSADTDALNARFTTPMTTPRAKLYQALYASLRNGATSGTDILSKMDYFYVLGAANAQAAQRNLVQDAYNLSPVNSPTFTADRGYQGDGSTSYLNTGFDCTSAVGRKIAQDDAHRGLWLRTDLANGAGVSFDFGAPSNSYIGRNNTAAGRMVTRANSATAVSVDSVFPGYGAWTRGSSTVIRRYDDGAPASGNPLSNTSAALSAGTDRILAMNASSFGANQVLFAHAGSTLTDAEILDLYNALNTFKTAIGA